MKKIAASVIILLLIASLPLPAKKKKEETVNLPEKYRKWLQEEVVYIISPVERSVFLQLQSDREREAFVTAFWKHRDPNPNTPQNEFQIEHYRRIEYANNWFGKETPAPGWRTDMGRIYITLGEPKTIERFENETEVHPTIIWFYQNMAEYGLPDAFNVVFFKKDSIGEYELYSPIRFGPQQLLINYYGDPTNYVAAYQKMQTIQPQIADVSLSLIPGEPLTETGSIASELLIRSKIPDAPQKKIDNLYAEKFLKYKEIVEVDYTANYIDSRACVDVIRDPAGIYFVHYLIEPNKLSVEESGGKFYTQLEVFGNVTDKNGNIVHQIKDIVPIEMNLEQMQRIKDKSFSFQSLFPLVPGKYKLTILLKNTIFKEYTSLEREIEVPENPPLRFSTLLLANRMAENPALRSQSKPFTVGATQLLPSPHNDFLKSDTLYLFFQIFGWTQALADDARLEFAIERENQKVKSFVKNAGEYPEAPNFREQFSLADLEPANYTLKVKLLSKKDLPLASGESYFYITPLSALTRPWVVSRPLPGSGDPLFQNELGNQYLSLKQGSKARPLLEAAYRKNPRAVKYALDFCKALQQDNEYQRILEIALPYYQGESKYEFSFLLGQTLQARGRFQEAIAYFRDAIAHFGTTFPVLNAIGECHLQLGNREEALQALEKSLEINVKQEKIRALVERIKGEKK